METGKDTGRRGIVKRLRKLRKSWDKVYFIMAIAMVIFAYGMAVGSFEIFPYQIVKSSAKTARNWIIFYKHYLGIKPIKHISKARHKGETIETYLPDKTYEGVTFIVSMWDHTLGMKLIDMDGSVIHKWRVSFSETFSEEFQKGIREIDDWDVDIHGTLLYPNGDVVFNFARKGLVKIDKWSKVIWKLPNRTHHSIFEDTEGNLWVPATKTHSHVLNRFPLLKAPIQEDLILKISPSGNILKQISILDIFYNSGQEGVLFANGHFKPSQIARDITHLNDIEILDESMADQFPLFEAGDILISLRHLNLITVIDHVTEKIKWSMTGPYIRQHDPDFLSNGQIMVFDNRTDGSGGDILGGSRILSIDPVMRKVHTIYKGGPQNKFYTKVRGKQQQLPNGNILITEHDAGRVFEVASSGEIVWSYHNRYDEDEVYEITQATRLERDYITFTEVKVPEN